MPEGAHDPAAHGLRGENRMHYQKYRLIIPFLAPALFLYSLFVLWPYGQAIYLSFTGWRGLSDKKPWVESCSVHESQM